MNFMDALKSMMGFPSVESNRDRDIFFSIDDKSDIFGGDGGDDLQKELQSMFEEFQSIANMFGNVNSFQFSDHTSTPLEDSSDDLHNRMLKPPSQDNSKQQQGFYQGQHRGHRQGQIGEDLGHPSVFGDISSFFRNQNLFEDNKPTQHKKEDINLDSVIQSKEDLREMFARDGSAYAAGQSSPGHSSQSENSVNRVRVWSRISADGKVEERRTVDDGRGNRRETVSKSIGDLGFTVEKRTIDGGAIEIDEQFNNMTKEDKENFEERWRRPTVDVKGREFPEQIDDDTKRIFRNLFGNGFPGFGRK